MRLPGSALLLATIGLVALAPSGWNADDYVRSIEQQRAARVTRLTAPDGWLALIGRHVLPAGKHRLGAAADNEIRLAAGPPHLGEISRAADGRVEIALAEGVEARIDGTEARVTELAYRTDSPTFVRTGTISFYVMPRGEQLFLRVRDTAGPRRKNFAGIEYFAIDPQWRIEARWVPYEQPREVSFGNVIGQTSTARISGYAAFTYQGREVKLVPIEEGLESLFFVFSDETSGHETYAAGRFLYADRPRDGVVVLDFNLAYNPPCAFTPFATCPLPPEENQVPYRLTAGEKAYRGEH